MGEEEVAIRPPSSKVLNSDSGRDSLGVTRHLTRPCSKSLCGFSLSHDDVTVKVQTVLEKELVCRSKEPEAARIKGSSEEKVRPRKEKTAKRLFLS